MAVKIVIADDHVMFREGLKQILELDEKIRVVAEASDGAECIEVLQNARQESEPDVLLLDIAMPGMNGFQVVDVLKKSGNVIPILILTASNEMDYLIHAINLGVDGYLLKECGTAELKKAIFTIVDGKSYIQPNLVPLLQQTMKKKKLAKKKLAKKKLDSLTDREGELLKLLSDGMSNKDIAERLSLSERTVKNHLSSIFKKLEVMDRTQAAVFAIRNHFIYTSES